MSKAILGRKLGMTQIFTEEGKVVPVTVVEAGGNIVIQNKTVETDGYNAVQLGFGEIKENKVTKPMKGHFEKAGVKPVKFIREMRLQDPSEYKVGDSIGVDIFAAGELVDVTGTSKGKGFAGGIKRWNQRRGPMGHGSKNKRQVGALAGAAYPGRVFKGNKSPGRTVSLAYKSVFGTAASRKQRRGCGKYEEQHSETAGEKEPGHAAQSGSRQSVFFKMFIHSSVGCV